MAWTESHLGGSGGGGASSLADLGDVALSSLTDNQLLKYNASSGKWENSSGDGQKFQPVIYSTEEREIGVWTDGKPLYEKTYNFSETLTCNSSAWTNTEISNSGIERIVGFACFNNGGTRFDCVGVNRDSSSGYIQILNTRNSTIAVDGLMLQYTKTTDTPGSGTWTPQGVPAVHYSTDEQIIGTWVDGSTVYEKTFTGNLTASPCNIYDLSSLNVKDVIDYSGFLKNPTASATYRIMLGAYINSNSNASIYITSGLVLQVFYGGDYANYYITVRYTKSSS